MAEVNSESLELECEQNDSNDDGNLESYQCSSCNLTFTNVAEHLKDFHGEQNDDDDEVMLIEENPLEEVEKSEGMAFVIKNKEGKFECKECFRTYTSLRRFLNHVKTHGSVAPEGIQKLEETLKQLEDSEEIFEKTPQDNGSGQSNFRCKICNTIFDSRKKMLLHYPIHRNVARAQKNRTIDSAKDSLHCKLCNRSLTNENEMKMHLNAHVENQAQGSKQAGGSEKHPQKKKTENGKYPCQYCEKTFSRPHEKVKHERIHTGEKPYSCDICGKQFRVTYCLSLHKKNVHSDERPYCCSFDGCNKRFKSQSVYNHHLNTHGSAKNFTCPFCSKAFKTSVQLSGHKNTHTKPFSCQVCSRAFASLYAVKIHMEIHRNLEANLKHVCKICSAQYGRRHALSDHMKNAHSGMENIETEQDEDIEQHYIIEETQTSAVGDDSEAYSVVIVRDDGLSNNEVV